MPQKHKKVRFEPSSCVACHKQAEAGSVDKFASGVHMSHAQAETKCSICHMDKGKYPFSVINTKIYREETEDIDLIKEKMTDWAMSSNMDNRHAQAGVFCTGCHGKDLPAFAVDVDNLTCLKCHGPLDALQTKTEPEQFKDRNPHKSHLGEVACTICHHMHSPQEIYCLKCHQKFIMELPK